MLKQKIKIIFILITLLIFPEFALGAPSISGVSGTVSDGESVIIGGSDFGSNTGLSNIMFLGGEAGIIENTATDTSPNNTSNLIFNESANPVIKAVTNNCRSGSKCFYTNPDAVTKYQSPVRYNYGSGIAPGEEVFVSFWTRTDFNAPAPSDDQWKMFRINFRDDIQDDSPQTGIFYHVYDGGINLHRPGPTAESVDAITDYAYLPGDSSSRAKWYRIDLRYKLSTIGQHNGIFEYTLYSTDGDAFNVFVNRSDIMNYWSGDTYTNHTDGIPDTSGSRLQWFIWQNWVNSPREIWEDDYFVQVGSQARVEICDTATWASRHFCDIQKPTTWNTNSLAIEFNKGGFANNSTVYLYVVDSAGVANTNGFPVVINSSDAIAPSAPTGLGVI